MEYEIAIITMDDGKANAISPAMLKALHTCLDQAEKEAKAVIITGREGRFSGGFDLKMMMGATGEEVKALVMGGGELAMRLYSFPMPVIAACTGHAVAMGCFILLSCDRRIGSAGAFKIGANETAINMVLPVFALELCKARINPLHMTNTVVNADLVDPDLAVEVGFLDRTVPGTELLGAAMAEAEKLKALPNGAHTGNKRQLRRHTLDVVAPTVARMA